MHVRQGLNGLFNIGVEVDQVFLCAMVEPGERLLGGGGFALDCSRCGAVAELN